MAPSLKLRRMTGDDVDFGMRLKEIAGWNQTSEDWRRFLALEPDGCFIGYLDDESVGTVTTIRYEDRFGWVGMVLVLPQFRRRGFGTILLQAGIDFLVQTGVETVKLDATPAGKRVYDRVGFVEEYRLDRWQGVGCGCAHDGVRLAEAADVERVLSVDRQAFGADRRRVLIEMMRQERNEVWVSESGPGAGYAITRPGANAWQLGPVVADDPEVGMMLLRAACDGLVGRPIYVDLIRSNIDAVRVAEEQGFVVQRELIRMYQGPNRHPGLPDWQFAVSGPEKG